MDIYDVMRTMAALREFTTDPLPYETLERILDAARFASGGGNRQDVRIVVIRDQQTRTKLAELTIARAPRYVTQLRNCATAQLRNGENPWNPLRPSGVPLEQVSAIEVPGAMTALHAGAAAADAVPRPQHRRGHRPGPRPHRHD